MRPFISSQTSAPPTPGASAGVGGADPRSRHLLIAFAWLSTLVSVSVYGFWQAVVPGDPDGLRLGQLLLACLLLAGSAVWKALRPLQGYLAVLVAVDVVTNFLHPLLSAAAAASGPFSPPGTHWLLQTFGDRVLKLAEMQLVIGVVVLGLHAPRRAVFLTVGRLDAPARRVPWLGIGADEPWTRLGPKLVLVLGGVFALALGFMLPPPADGLARLVNWLPLIMLVAAMNAVFEEVVFRAAPLSQLWKAVGVRQATVLSAVYFGLGHYSGSVPSGPLGALQAGFLGWLLAKAMLETRGLGWPWLVHCSLDTIIFAFLVMQPPPG